MKYDKNQLLINQLPTPVFIKNFVEGHSADYEDYLTTFINLSRFVKDYGNEKFTLRKHNQQSQGQSDIFNSLYELDYKILVDPDYMEAKSMLTNSITEYYPGVTFTGPSKLKGNKRALHIIQCFRNQTINDLISIENGIKKVLESKVIKQVLKTVSVNKNILFFIPFDYSFKENQTDDKIAKFIIECISLDLKGLIEYRNNKVNKDTFIAFISKEYFVIAKEENNTLIYYDMINTNQSDLYNYLFNVGRL